MNQRNFLQTDSLFNDTFPISQIIQRQMVGL